MSNRALSLLLSLLYACGGSPSSDGGDGGGDDGDGDAIDGGQDIDGGAGGEPGQIDTALGDQGWFDMPLSISDAQVDGDGTAVFLGYDSFGRLLADGRWETDGSAPGFRARLLALGPQGHVVEVGESTTGYQRVRRYDSRYQPDLTFAFEDASMAGRSINDVLVGADGSTYFVGSKDGKLSLSKLTPSGALDASFATGGHLEVASGLGALSGKKLAWAEDGDLWVGCDSGFTPCITRVDAGGTVDARFAGGVVVLEGFGPRNLRDLMVDTEGRMHVLGMIDDSIQVARLAPDGTLDASFGVGGIQTVAIDRPFGENVEFRKLLPDGDGGAYVAGDYSRRESGSIDEIERKGWIVHLDQTFSADGRFGGDDILVVDLNRDQDPALVFSTVPAVAVWGEHLLVGGSVRNASGVIRQAGRVVALWK